MQAVRFDLLRFERESFERERFDEILDGIVTSIEHELRRRAQRAKAERTANWTTRMRDPSGRVAALYARAADNSPTVYLRTAGQGPTGQPVHGPDSDVTDRTAPSGPTAHLDPDPDDESDSDDNSTGKKDQTKRSMQLLESSPEISLIVNELDYT